MAPMCLIWFTAFCCYCFLLSCCYILCSDVQRHIYKIQHKYNVLLLHSSFADIKYTIWSCLLGHICVVFLFLDLVLFTFDCVVYIDVVLPAVQQKMN